MSGADFFADFRDRAWHLGFRSLIKTRLFQRKLLRLQRKILRRVSSVRANSPSQAAFPKPLPRYIWIYWDTGEAAAPDLVRYCICRWKALHKDWVVTVLDRPAAEAIVDMTDMPATIQQAHYADVLRLRLLKRFGGIWADATCLPTRPLEEWLPPLMQSGFFAFAAPGRDRLLANWFLASEARGLVVSRWERNATRYWNGRLEPDAYFWVHYLFEWLIRMDREARAVWHMTPKLRADMAFFLQRAMTDDWNEQETLDRLAEAGPMAAPIHKLTWKHGSLNRLNGLLAKLSAEEQGRQRTPEHPSVD